MTQAGRKRLEHPVGHQGGDDSEGMFRELCEGASDLIQSITPEGRFIYANRAWFNTLGYTPDDLGNFAIGESAAVCGKAQDSFDLKTYPPPETPADHVTDQIIAASQAHYALPTKQAEQELAAQYVQAPATAADDDEDFGRA